MAKGDLERGAMQTGEVIQVAFDGRGHHWLTLEALAVHMELR